MVAFALSLVLAVGVTTMPLAAQDPRPAAPPPQAIDDALREAFRLLDRGDLAAAAPLFERALAEASAGKRVASEAEARRGLGLLATKTKRHDVARDEIQRALALYETLSDRSGIGRSSRDLGNVLYSSGDRERARGLFLRAIEAFQAVGDLAEENEVLYKVAYSTSSSEEAVRLIERGLVVSRQLGDKNSEGVYLLIWGNRLSAEGNYASAVQRFQQAIERIEEFGASRPQARSNLTLALTSLGRLYQSHGEFERAIAIYRRALALHEQTGEPHRTLPILNAIALGHQSLGEYKTALQLHRQIFELARESGSKSWIALATGRLGGSYLHIGDYRRAVELLQEAIPQNEAAAQAVLYQQLSAAYSGLGRADAALEAAETSVTLSTPLPNWETRFDALNRRARARHDKGLTADALADAREALLAAEQVRAQLVPADFLKRGFADQRQAVSTLAIGLLSELGRPHEAFEAAEQGRARAFLDLLASRDLDMRPDGVGSLSALYQMERQLKAGTVSDPPPAAFGLATRGSDSPSAGNLNVWRRAEPELRSPASVVPMSLGESAAVAGRLGSTVVSYWVGERETFVWVVKANGDIRVERIPVASSRLNALVRETTAGPATGQSRATGATDEAGATRSAEAVEMRAMAGAYAPRVRGAALIALDTRGKQAWRQLYALLVAPVRSALPSAPGSLLTIVPHGPLFGLSFAALIDERSRYLIEDYTVHYAPAVGLFSYTGRRNGSTVPPAPSYLLVANPRAMPALAPNRPLPPLPGSAREVQAIARLLPSDQVTLLTGASAREETFRSLAGGKAIVHIATHGILRDEDPLGSFLALGGTGSVEATDGRLTAQEIYALTLQADLVVLSACRTGLGRVSGDGIVGLTRAFFYAGAPTVVATLWDVADEPAEYLMPRFYRLLNKSGAKSRALREAQLDMLRALRASRVTVTTPAGPLALPEHPAFWASFVLQGEP